MPMPRRARGLWVIADLTYEKLIYDAVPHNLPRVLVDRAARSHRPLQRRVEGVRDDRLALRLGDWTGEADRRVQRRAGALDVERRVDHAEGGDRGADRPAGQRDGDARRVPRAPRQGLGVADRRIRCFTCVKPRGAFYLFPYAVDALEPAGVRTTAEFAEALLQRRARRA